MHYPTFQFPEPYIKHQTDENTTNSSLSYIASSFPTRFNMKHFREWAEHLWTRTTWKFPPSNAPTGISHLSMTIRNSICNFTISIPIFHGQALTTNIRSHIRKEICFEKIRKIFDREFFFVISFSWWKIQTKQWVKRRKQEIFPKNQLSSRFFPPTTVVIPPRFFRRKHLLSNKHNNVEVQLCRIWYQQKGSEKEKRIMT